MIFDYQANTVIDELVFAEQQVIALPLGDTEIKETFQLAGAVGTSISITGTVDE